MPGYRRPGRHVPPPDASFQEGAWATIARTAGAANVAVVLGTERVVDGTPIISAMVINRDGTIAGFSGQLVPISI